MDLVLEVSTGRSLIVAARALALHPRWRLSVGFTAGISHCGATRAMRFGSSTASGLSPYGFMGSSRHHDADLVVHELE